MRAIIFANGEFRNPAAFRAPITPDDLIICADGGTAHALTAGLEPHVIIGDMDSMDSISAAQCAQLKARGCRFITFPARKDETDLELALKHAVAEGADQIRVFGALGGRLDQTVANVLLLAMPDLAGVDVRIVDGRQEAFVVRDEVTIRGRVGDTVSLIPLAGDATGITTEGLEWALSDSMLPFGLALGVSNVMTAATARVRVGAGLLLVVWIPGEEFVQPPLRRL